MVMMNCVIFFPVTGRYACHKQNATANERRDRLLLISVGTDRYCVCSDGAAVAGEESPGSRE